MYDFKDFEGEDKYERFKALQKKIHQDAIDEFMKEQHDEAMAKGESRTLIPFSKGVPLKDGTKLTPEELDKWTETNGYSNYSASDTFF